MRGKPPLYADDGVELCDRDLVVAKMIYVRRFNVLENALRNAREALSRKLAEAASQEKLLGALGAAFGMAAAPRRVEVYDNSHIMGANAIGAMIVAGPEGFVKNQYRTFNIKSAALTPGDDYAMMREVLTRRFARLQREATATVEEGAFPDRPDLVIIDGGRGQFEAARHGEAAFLPISAGGAY